MSVTSLPHAVLQCCEALWKHGYEAYPVGGCVRDRLLGREPEDWDVTTSAIPEQVQKLFHHTVPTGIIHGTVTVVFNDMSIEVTTFRRESGYADARHPNSVSFDTDLMGDLSRRDFTINAMALGRDGRIIDPHGGRTDLRNGLIRTVGDPQKRFSEDALRILRAVRFAAQLGFSIEKETEKAMQQQSDLVDQIAAERIAGELERILCSPNPHMAKELVGLGILDRFYREWEECDWSSLAQAPATPVERWKAFCELTGFPVAALPLKRQVKMAVLHPEREIVRGLALTGKDLVLLGYRGQEIGAAQKRLAAHVRKYPQDNCPERLKEILLSAQELPEEVE